MNQRPMPKPWDAVVIGGGPAGLAAGMHLARAGYSALLIERGRLGGQARILDQIENYPGFPRAIRGRELMARWARQALRWGLAVRRNDALGINLQNGWITVRLRDNETLKSKAVIRCTGANFRKLGVPGEKRLFGRGLWHAAFENAHLFRRKQVAVVGGGEAALHQALHLSRYAERVCLLTRSPGFKAHPLLKERIAQNKGIVHIPRVLVEGVEKRKDLIRLRLRQNPNGKHRALDVSGLFVLIGRAPDPLDSRRAHAGLFVAGDARGDRFRQVAVAGGDGIKAAMDCMEYLETFKAEANANT